MKYKASIIVALMFQILSHTFGVIPKHSEIYYEATRPEVHKAMRYGAKARIVYRVIDDEGNPITNTVVNGTWQNDYPRKIWQRKYKTDEKGCFIAEDKVGHSFACQIQKDGYYNSYDVVTFDWRAGVSPLVKDGKWQPYGESRTVIVKRKKNQMDSSYLWYTVIDIPVTNIWLGFDLESFAWVKPYGKGENSDMLLRFNSDPINRYSVNWATMEVSFTNNPYAGFYIQEKDAYSEFKSVYHADTNRIFRTDITYSIGKSIQEENLLDEKHYMVVRTRTKVNEEGELISAHYGKIYGRWGIWGGTRAQMMFFNPTPNDTNLEHKR